MDHDEGDLGQRTHARARRRVDAGYTGYVDRNDPRRPCLRIRPTATTGGLDRVALDELIRFVVGGGWICELTAEGEWPPNALDALVVAARQVGRPVRIAAINDQPNLPTPTSKERWVSRDVDGMFTWFLEVPHPPAWMMRLKRALDVMLSLAALTLLSPVFLAIALAVRASSPGPVFFKWNVLGVNGRPFTGYKFRTMVADADLQRPKLLRLNEMKGPVFKIANDPRVTPLGRWLRKYSLDELPQLWSVLKGDLSLVGPRPSFPSEYQGFKLWQLRKLSIKPGLTCLWQVNGRNAISDFDEWARLDLAYIDGWSFWLDLKILARTLVTVIKGTGH